MAITKTLITGKVLVPSGAAPAIGALTARLSQSGSTLDGAASHRVASSIRADLGADGALPAGFGLCPNDAIVPSGTYYRVQFYTKDDRGVPYSWEERWQVATSPSPIDIGAVPRIDVVPGVAVQTAQAVSDAVAALAYQIDGGAPDSTWGGAPAPIDGGTP